MDASQEYEETLSSGRTEAVFVALSLLFLSFSIWRVVSSGVGGLAIASFTLFALFVFYSLNYNRLSILMNREALVLRFGIFSRTIPWSRIESAFIDGTSLLRIGGAGIHFTMIHRRYRMYWNLLEFPRVVLALTGARGWVRDVAFTTRRPREVLTVIEGFMDQQTERAKR
jgi:hypothetical protein